MTTDILEAVADRIAAEKPTPAPMRLGNELLPSPAKLFPDEQTAYNDLLALAAGVVRLLKADGIEISDSQFVRRVEQAWQTWRAYC